MIYQVTFGGNAFEEVLFRVKEFIVYNGIKDVRACTVSPVIDPDMQETIGFTALTFYTKEGK